MARKVDHQQRRREIAERALKLFSQVGYDNVSLIMIAAASGVSRTILYRYFCSKREIMDAAILSVTELMGERCRRELARKRSYRDRLEAVCHVVAETMFAERQFVVAIFDFVIGQVRTGADMNGVIGDFTRGTRSLVHGLLRHGQRRGEFPAILDPARTTDAIYAEFESCAMRILLGSEKTAAAAKVRFSDMIHAISAWQ